MEKQVMKTILRQNKCGQTCLFRVWVLEFLRLIQSVWCLLFWLSFFFHKMSIRITHTRGRLRGDWVLRIVQGTWWIFSWGKWLLLLLVLTLIPWKCPVVFVYRTISSVVLSVNGLPQWLSGKELACKAGIAVGASGLIPGQEISPGAGTGKSLQYSCLGNPMDSPRVCKSWTRLSDETTNTWQEGFSFFFLFYYYFF